MLEEISIKRFKSLRNADAKFGRVNLFIGNNGSGKSNALEAIGLLSASLYRGVLDAELAKKGVRLTPPALMKSAFKNENLPTTLALKASFSDNISYDIGLSSGDSNTHLSFHSEKCEWNGETYFGRSNRGTKIAGQKSGKDWQKARSLWDQARPAFDFPDEIVNEFSSLSRFAIYSPQTEFLRGVRSGLAEEPPIGLHGEGLPSAAAVLIRTLNNHKRRTKKTQDLQQLQDAVNLVWLPGWTDSVRTGRIDPLLVSKGSTSLDGDIIYFHDKYMRERRNTLSAYDSSEGTLFLLFMSILLAHPEAPPVFAVDNVDSALNPALTRALIETTIKVAKRKCAEKLLIGPEQVFLTSHNPTSLDAFDLFDDDQRVFVVKRNSSGHSTINRLKPRDGWTRNDWSLAFGNRKLSQLWIDGEIGGALGER